MVEQKKPTAFMSYVHSDDVRGRLTEFRKLLSEEANLQIEEEEEFRIFQDRNDIGWGEDWKERIEDSLDEATFLIPIITPGFFHSLHCRHELQRFLEREEKLNRNDLIFPVYYVDTPLINDEEKRATDELAQVIATRQYADWRDLQTEPYSSPRVVKMLEQLGTRIRDALACVLTTLVASGCEKWPAGA